MDFSGVSSAILRTPKAQTETINFKNNMKRHLLLIMLSLGLMAVTGCKKSPSEEASDLKFLPGQEFTYVFEPDAGEATLQFDAAQIWMAAKTGSELENEWLTLTPAYGQGRIYLRHRTRNAEMKKELFLRTCHYTWPDDPDES